ncbi:MAG: PKD domain-containing protein [Spirosoma sp.]|nr:PKD domain-containing protein [Spirosoma sp.]
MKYTSLLLLVFLHLTTTLVGQKNTCNLSLSTFRADNNSVPPNYDISITGSTNAICKNVNVTLQCQGNPTIHGESVPVTNGTFRYTFPYINCPCNGASSNFTIDIECADDKTCKISRTLEIPCPVIKCPSITNVNATIGACVGLRCKKQSITFTPIVSGSYDSYSWNFGDGIIVTNMGVSTSIVHEYSHFPEGEPTFTIFKNGCIPIIHPIDLQQFQPCDDCPDENSINLSQLLSNKCNLTGSIGTIGTRFCEEQYTTFIINYGDNSQSESHNISQLNNFPISHDYPNDGEFLFTVQLLKNGEESCVFSKPITISDCKKVIIDDDDDDDDDSSCFFCFCTDNIICCILYALFIASIIAMGISLIIALCVKVSTKAWIAFGIAVALAIGLGIALSLICDYSICQLLLGIGIGSAINWAIVCETNAVTLFAPCTSWFCQMSRFSILGFRMKNSLIVNILLYILLAIFCGISQFLI